VTQQDLNAGSVVNTATATSGTTTSPPASATALALQDPQLDLDKAAVPTTYDHVGQVIVYTYTLTNTANVTLAGPFTVTDDRTTVTCPSTATLVPGASLTCGATYTITQADLDVGSVTNHATGGATFDGNPVHSDQATATVDAAKAPALSLQKSVMPGTYDHVGQVLSYTYTVTNTGNVTMTAPVTIADDTTTVTCPTTLLAPTQSLDCTATYAVTQQDLNAGAVFNTASASSGTTSSPVASATALAAQEPQLGLTKTPSSASYDHVGQVVAYTYTLTNTANVTLSGPFTVADDRTTVTCPSTVTLVPGASLNCAATYTITQADLDAGQVVNHAIGLATFDGNPVHSAPATAVTEAVKDPSLTLAKSVMPGSYDHVGQTLSYTYTVTNTGNVTMTAPVTVVDDTTTVSCPTTLLAPTQSLGCTATYAITQGDIDAGAVINTAFASSGTTSSPVASATALAAQDPQLGLTKTPSPTTYDHVGQVITYTYTLTNTANVTLSGPFTVTDDKTTVTCPSTATLDPGTSVTCTATYAITQVDLDAGQVINHATGTATFDGNPVHSAPVTAVVEDDKNPALTLAKSVAPGTYSTVGQVLSYTYVVTNTGNVTMTAPVTIADDRSTVTCPTTLLAPTQSLTCTAAYTVTQADIDAGAVINTASATSGTTTSPTDSATALALQDPQLELTKSPSPATYDHVGQVVTYTYTLTNTANVTVTGPFTVTDDKTTVTCPSTAILVPLASLTCTATYTITQADLDAGSVTNHATGLASFAGDPVGSNVAVATVEAVKAPALTLQKSVTPHTYDHVGQVLSYTYVVTNDGNVTMTAPVTIADDTTTVACPTTLLAPTESLTCTATDTITQVEIDAGAVVNTASATSGTTTSPTDSATALAVQQVRLDLTKTASPTTYDHVGQVVGYTYTLANTGNVTLTGPFTVTDDRTTVTCPSTATLVPLGSLICTATYTITQADLDAGQVINHASGTGSFGTTPVVSGPAAATVTAAPQTRHVTVSKSANRTTVSSAGDQIVYTVSVLNDGAASLSAPALTDPRCLLTYQSGDANNNGKLDVGETWRYSCTYVVTAADIAAGTIPNTATATATDGDGDAVSAIGSATVAVLATQPTPTTTPTSTPSGPLPFTGQDVMTMVIVGIALILVGLGVTIGSRRRRKSSP
jgi:hypothetical protein